MAINYLNTVNLNKNQLENAAIQNLSSDPASGVLGQVYFNTSDGVLKICTTAGSPTGAVWSEVGGGVETLDTTDGTYINLTPDTASTGDVIVTADLSAEDGTAASTVRFLTKDNKWAVPAFDDYSSWSLDGDSGTAETVSSGETVDIAGGLKITTDIAANRTLNIVHDLQAQTDTTSTAAPAYGGTFTTIDTVTRDTTGHVTGINVKTVTIPAAEDYTFIVTADSGTDQTIDNGDTLDIAGGTNITTVVGATDTVTVNLDDSITLAGELTVSGTGQSSVAGQLTIPQTPSADTDAASKHYVDQAVTGALSYQGGYDASTNSPDLDTNSSIEVKKGWTYTVTADGLFFTEQVRVGDVLISEADQAAGASALANWTTVQNNVDLADASTVGIGNVVPGTSATVTAPYSNGTATLDVVDSTASQKGAVIVAESDPIEVSYASGTATVSIKDSDAAQKGAVIVAGGTGISVAYSGGTATVSATANGARQDLLSTDSNVTRTEANGITTFALDVGAILGSTSALDVKAEIISAAGQTVYTDITRSGTTLNVIFTGSVADSAYQALLIDIA